MFELFARVSKTTVSPSTSLIWRVNQCLRPYVSIYQPQCAHERYIHIKCRWLCCLRTIQLALREIRAPSRRSWLITPSFAPHVEGAVARSPVFVVVAAAAAVGVRHRWMPGKPCGIYRVPLIYALLFSWLEKKAHRAAEYPGNWELSACRFWANSETNGLGATGSHGGRVTHLCGAVRASQLRLRQVGLKVYAEVGRRLRCVCVYANGPPADTGPRQPWIGKITFIPLRFLKTPARTRDHRVMTTATAARHPASTWAGRSTPSTHRRPWEPWSRPAFLTLLPLTVCRVCGRNLAYPSSSTTTSTSSNSRRSSRLQATVTPWNRADITCHSPGWKPLNPTHTPGKDSGQVNTQTNQRIQCDYERTTESDWGGLKFLIWVQRGLQIKIWDSHVCTI